MSFFLLFSRVFVKAELKTVDLNYNRECYPIKERSGSEMAGEGKSVLLSITVLFLIWPNSRYWYGRPLQQYNIKTKSLILYY